MRRYLYCGYEEIIEEKNQEIERLKNIIKEVRECVEETLCYSTCDGMKYIMPSGKNILEILDKEDI